MKTKIGNFGNDNEGKLNESIENQNGNYAKYTHGTNMRHLHLKEIEIALENFLSMSFKSLVDSPKRFQLRTVAAQVQARRLEPVLKFANDRTC